LVDIAVIGAGPAGFSAALNARKRERSVVVIGQNTGWLTHAERIDNYAGMPGVSGADMLAVMRDQAQAMGAELRSGVVHQVIDMGGTFALSLGADFVEARKIILCTGAAQPKLLPGEERLLGCGVSYCGTCDAMLYRGKNVAVIGEGAEAVSEANFLMNVCAQVTYYGDPDEKLDRRIEMRAEKPEEITGDLRVSGLIAGGQETAFDGVFIFRETMVLSSLMPGIDTDGAFIRVNRQMKTSLPGVFAAGDCTGLPLQVAKAVGEGCIAALCACQELELSEKC